MAFLSWGRVFLMIRKSISYIGFVLLLVFVFSSAYAGGEAESFAPETEALVIVSSDGAQHDFHIEIARTPTEWKYGLMYRNEMPEDHGMLFIFPKEQMRAFWMKNTFIPLDMVFIRADGTIVNIEENSVPLDLTSRPSKKPSLAVLEINGGVSEKLNIRTGDVVHHNAFGNAIIDNNSINQLAE